MRITVESTGTHGASLLGHVQAAGIEVLEVAAPDKQDRRRRGKDDYLRASPRRFRISRLFQGMKDAIPPWHGDAVVDLR